MRKVVTVIGLVFSLAVNGLAQAAEPQDLGLTKIKDSRTNVAFLKIDQDFSKYDSIVIGDIVTDDVEVKEPSRSAIAPNDWEMDAERQARVKDMHRKAYQREFAETNGLELADEIDANTLVLVTRLVKVEPSVGFDSDRQSSRVRVYSESTGSAVIEMYLLDGETGEVVAAVATARKLGNHWVHNNSVSNASNVQFAFNMWARQAHEAVENLSELAADSQG